MTDLKELVYKINHEENFDKAQGMLSMLNSIFGTSYGFLNRRVVRFDVPSGSTSMKYSHCHDLYTEL